MLNVEKVKEDLYTLLSLNNTYEYGKVETNESTFKRNIDEEIGNLKEYFKKIKDFQIKSEVKTLTKNEKELYLKAIKVLEEQVEVSVFLDRETAKKRYEKEKNIYTSRQYAEFPMRLIKGLPKVYNELTMFALIYSDISSLSCNLKYLYNHFKKDETAIKVLTKLIGEDTIKDIENKEDLYFDKYENASEEQKIQMIKENVEITNVAVGENSNSDWAIMVLGNYDSRESQYVLPLEFTDFDKYHLALLKNNSRFGTYGNVNKSVIERYEKLVNIV